MIYNKTAITQGESNIFIVGMARSGTTLLSEILNAHSEIAVSPETHYFRKYWTHRKKKNLKKRILLNKKFLASTEFKQFGFSNEEMHELEEDIFNEEREGRQEILDIVLTKHRLKQKKLFWCEKSTVHLLYLPQIAELFPTGKFICLVRDPRDVCLSLQKVPFNPGSTISIARRWRRYLKMSLSYLNEYNEIFLEVKFEDLINRPEYELKKICKFLKIGYQSRMLNRKNNPSTFDKKKEYWKLNSVKPINKNNHGKWKNEMKPGEIYFMQKYLAKEIDRYNYSIKSIEFNLDVLWTLIKIVFHWFFTVSTNLTYKAFGVGRYN